MTRILLDILAIALILSGAVILPLPIPIGLILLVAGIVVLIISEDWARAWARKLRSRNERIDQLFKHIEKYAPPFVAEAIRRTEP